MSDGFKIPATRQKIHAIMSLQDQYDDAMFDFSAGEYARCIDKLQAALAEDPAYFEARLALGMAEYRRGNYAAAIAEGHKAEKLKPHEQLVHTNLSLFYMKAGDKKTAEHHGLQARIASWREPVATTANGPSGDPELQMAKPKPPPMNFPDQPWKKKNVSTSQSTPAAPQASESEKVAMPGTPAK